MGNPTRHEGRPPLYDGSKSRRRYDGRALRPPIPSGHGAMLQAHRASRSGRTTWNRYDGRDQGDKLVRERPITFSGELIVSDREVADLASGVFADTGDPLRGG